MDVEGQEEDLVEEVGKKISDIYIYIYIVQICYHGYYCCNYFFFGHCLGCLALFSYSQNAQSNGKIYNGIFLFMIYHGRDRMLVGFITTYAIST